jgi:hypothetical protein
MDQNQQNIIKPTNHKKFGRAIFVRNFRNWAKSNKIGARKRGERLQSVNQRGSDTKMM